MKKLSPLSQVPQKLQYLFEFRRIRDPLRVKELCRHHRFSSFRFKSGHFLSRSPDQSLHSCAEQRVENC